MKRIGALMVGTAAACLAGGAAAAYDSPERFETKNICTFVAGVTTHVPPEPDGDAPIGRRGMFERDGLAMQGVLDLDGDGTFEIVKNGDMGRHGGDLFDIQTENGESILEGGIVGGGDEPSGTGAGFANFLGRWYLIVFASEGGAFPRGAYTFEKGTLKRQLACRFDSDVTETMQAATGVEGDDAGWCTGNAVAEAKANRLKPTIALSEAEAKALTVAYEELTGPYAGNTTYAGTEIFAPKSGPFAGKLLWRVSMSSDAGRGCTGTGFYLVTKDANGGYTLAPPEDQQTLLTLQSAYANSGDPIHCGAYPELFEANGRFFLDRTAGDSAPNTDEMLAHTIAEWTKDGALRELCRADWDVVPRVTWTRPDLPQ